MSGAFGSFLLWLWLAILGFLLTRSLLRHGNPWLVLGSALPVALLALLGCAFPLARILGHPQGWVLAALLLFVLTIVLYARREKLIDRPLEDFGFSPWQWGCFMTLWTTAGLVMHTREALGPEDDYWIHFPLIALLQRGEFPPPNPFFDNLVLHGHFGRDYLIAVLSWLHGGGEALLSSTWIFNHALQTSAFLLAFGLGRRAGGTAGGFLMASFLFFGISVGSRVGLVDTYDNNNLLVYVLLLVFVAYETTQETHWRGEIAFCLGLGVYGIIYETHLLLFLIALWGGPLLWRRQGPLSWRQWLRPLAISTSSLILAACLGGPLQDLALRALGRSDSNVHHAATYQEQRVQIAFPKEHLFQILVGPERYRRLSYVYQGKAFAGWQNRDAAREGDSRQAFHYAFILGPDVLLMHWLALYLGLPAGLWVLTRGRPEGRLLWLFGLIAFLVPALVDFGPVHEREYFRWEFAAGFGFAGALATAMSDLWSRGSTPRRIALVLLALAVTLGGERKINRTLIDIDKLPAEQQAIALTPFYPSPRQWLLQAPQLNVTPELLEAALELQRRSLPSDRMVTDLDARSHWEIFRESTVCALAGLRSVGHVSPPPWMPDGIAPFFRDANWNAWWQTGDPRVLPSLRARWLLTHREEHRTLLERAVRESQLQEIAQHGPVSLWQYHGPITPLTRPADAPPLTLVAIERGPETSLQSETAQPLTLVFDSGREADIGIRWVPLEGTDPGGPIAPLVLRDRPSQKGAWRVAHYLVPPLVEGDYRLEVTVDGQPAALTEAAKAACLVRFSWSSQARQAQLRWVAPDRVAVDPGSSGLQPPATVGLRLWRLDEQRYHQPFGWEAKGLWEGAAEVQLTPLGDFSFPVLDTERADLFLLDRSGREILLLKGRSAETREAFEPHE